MRFINLKNQMSDLSKIYLYRMTHIDNIPHIVANGITHYLSPNKNNDYKNIGDNSIINRRSEIILEDDTKLSDYIPFYFSYRTPMLFVIWKGFNNVKNIKQEDIVYIVSSVQKMIDLGVNYKFTDGHAVAGLSYFYTKETINEIDTLLDWMAIKATDWKTEPDLKRRKEAEFLVLGDINYESILGYIGYNQNAVDKMQKIDSTKRTVIRTEYYF